MTQSNPALSRMLNKGRETAQEARQDSGGPPAPEKPPKAAPGPGKRSVGTRLTPELHSWVRHTVLDLSDELGHRVYVEQVLEALLLEMREDAALRARVAGRVKREG